MLKGINLLGMHTRDRTIIYLETSVGEHADLVNNVVPVREDRGRRGAADRHESVAQGRPHRNDAIRHNLQLPVYVYA